MIGSEAFAIALDLATTGARLSATWSPTGAPLQFADIAAAFGWHDMPAPPDGLDLALTGAGFIYDFTTGALVLAATSATYGRIAFVTEKVAGTRTYLLDLDVPLNIKLSDIPVAGPQIPGALDLGSARSRSPTRPERFGQRGQRDQHGIAVDQAAAAQASKFRAGHAVLRRSAPR